MLELLKNKHMILAMFIAPVLAIVAYFAVDRIVTEPPQAAQQGQSYPLAAKSNCRYESGRCTLKNGEIEIHLHAETITESQLVLAAQTNIAVESVLIALTPEQADFTPTAMQQDNAEQNQWTITLDLPQQYRGQREADVAAQEKPQQSDLLKLRIAVQAKGAIFFAETGTDFFIYETTFSRDNFSSI